MQLGFDVRLVLLWPCAILVLPNKKNKAKPSDATEKDPFSYLVFNSFWAPSTLATINQEQIMLEKSTYVVINKHFLTPKLV